MMIASTDELCIVCFGAKIELVSAEIHGRLNAPLSKSPFSLIHESIPRFVSTMKGISISGSITQLPKEQNPRMSRFLLWSPEACSSHTIMTENIGENFEHGVFLMSEKVDWRCISVLIDRQNGDVRESCRFDYYEDYHRVTRKIGAVFDDRDWVYYSEGEMLWFENPQYSKRKKIPERLNREIIVEYLYKLGYPVMDEKFWRTEQEAVLIEQRLW